MGDFIEIPADNVIEESITESPGYGSKPYLAYLSPDDSRQKIRVNTYFLPQGGNVRLCVCYDRGLCNTLEEYRRLPLSYIESMAYGSWMDGAR